MHPISDNIRLPNELWHEILAFAMVDQRVRDGTRWRIDYSEDGTPKPHFLRAFASINRATRAKAMHLMWTDVTLHLGRDSRCLLQLIQDLSPVDGPLPGPRHYIETILVRPVVDRLWKFYLKDDPENQPSGRQMQLLELSERLMECPQLTKFRWGSRIKPGPAGLTNSAPVALPRCLCSSGAARRQSAAVRSARCSGCARHD